MLRTWLFRTCLVAILAILAAAGGGAASAHRDPCHLRHACPSDHHTYAWHGLLCTSHRDERLPTDTVEVRNAGRSYWCHRGEAASTTVPTEGATGTLRASWTLTPGVADPRVTQATVQRTVCVRGWASTIRPPEAYTEQLKLVQMREYRVGGPPSAYEEDHLISLELGGAATDPRNLWPEPVARAHAVDELENRLHEALCAGTITLVQAQQEISRIKHTQG